MKSDCVSPKVAHMRGCVSFGLVEVNRRQSPRCRIVGKRKENLGEGKSMYHLFELRRLIEGEA